MFDAIPSSKLRNYPAVITLFREQWIGDASIANLEPKDAVVWLRQKKGEYEAKGKSWSEQVARIDSALRDLERGMSSSWVPKR